MKKITNPLRGSGLKNQKNRMCYFIEESLQYTLGSPLLRKLDCKLR